MSFTLYTYQPNYRAYKILIAAEYNGVQIEVPPFQLQKDNVTKEFLAKNPMGKVPVLDTPHGAIFESNAITRYVARVRQDGDLYGSTFFESALVDQWVDFSANELEPARAIWLFPILGYMQFDNDAYESAKADVAKCLKVLEQHLQTRTYLVGHKITLADIVVVSALVDLYKLVFDPSFRKPFVNVNRWFNTCINQPQFAKVIGDVQFAQKETVAAQGEHKQAGGKKDAKPQQAKQEQKPKAEKAEKAEKPKAEKPAAAPAPAADDEEAAEKEEKKKDPLDALPPSSMILDAVKKNFFEKRLQNKLPDFWPEFWAQFDDKGYSIWTSEYNYASENTVYWLTSNLVAGFLQRLEDARKYAFGSVNILGQSEEQGPFPILGAWIFRGPAVPDRIKECPDAEYHTFKKVDHTDAAVRQRIQDLFIADNIDGQKSLDRRYFK